MCSCNGLLVERSVAAGEAVVASRWDWVALVSWSMGLFDVALRAWLSVVQAVPLPAAMSATQYPHRCGVLCQSCLVRGVEWAARTKGGARESSRRSASRDG